MVMMTLNYYRALYHYWTLNYNRTLNNYWCVMMMMTMVWSYHYRSVVVMMMTMVWCNSYRGVMMTIVMTHLYSVVMTIMMALC
jgi:hypothetical protein